MTARVDKPYRVVIQGHPQIIADRWYVATKRKIVVVDQPINGFEKAKDGWKWLREKGATVDRLAQMMMVPGDQVDWRTVLMSEYETPQLTKLTAAKIALYEYEKHQEEKYARLLQQCREIEAIKAAEHIQIMGEVKERFDKSAIPVWFPGVEWTFVERHKGDDIWQSGEDDDPDRIRLLIHKRSENSIAFGIREGIRFVTKKRYIGYDSAWEGSTVNSAKDIGEELMRIRNQPVAVF